jgi:hypothetical protein
MTKIYLWANKIRARDLVGTPLEDGSNLPDVKDRRLRLTIPLPVDPKQNGTSLIGMLEAIAANGFVRIRC